MLQRDNRRAAGGARTRQGRDVRGGRAAPGSRAAAHARAAGRLGAADLPATAEAIAQRSAVNAVSAVNGGSGSAADLRQAANAVDLPATADAAAMGRRSAAVLLKAVSAPASRRVATGAAGGVPRSARDLRADLQAANAQGDRPSLAASEQGAREATVGLRDARRWRGDTAAVGDGLRGAGGLRLAARAKALRLPGSAGRLTLRATGRCRKQNQNLSPVGAR